MNTPWKLHVIFKLFAVPVPVSMVSTYGMLSKRFCYIFGQSIVKRIIENLHSCTKCFYYDKDITGLDHIILKKNSLLFQFDRQPYIYKCTEVLIVQYTYTNFLSDARPLYTCRYVF